MIWALLALLGVPIWIIVGVLGAAVVSRRRFQQTEGVFPVRIRTSVHEKFQRKAHARWVHDVLIVNKGLALARTDAYGVQSLVVSPRPSDEVKGLGEDPSFLAIRLDGGQEACIATPSNFGGVAVGPFSLT